MTDEEIQLEAKEIVSELVRYCDIVPEHREYVVSKLQRVVRTTYTEAIEEAANVPRRLKFREDSSREYQNGYSDALLDVGEGIAAVISSSHGETEGEGM